MTLSVAEILLIDEITTRNSHKFLIVKMGKSDWPNSLPRTEIKISLAGSKIPVKKVILGLVQKIC